MKIRQRCIWLAAAVLLVASCGEPQRNQFKEFSVANQAQISRYKTYLQQHGVDNVAPLEQLLRTSRRWRHCDTSPYAIAPEALWRNQLPTLRLLARLQTEIPLQEIKLRSVYRNSAVNRCSGGSTRSQHLQFNAIDFDVQLKPGSAEKLCEFWRTHGPALRMGLGFYSETALHIDTAGFRTWGKTHKSDSSLCLLNEAASVEQHYRSS